MTDKPLWVNVLAGILGLIVLVAGFFFSLDLITGYGQFEKVPAVEGQHILAAQKILEDKGFAVVIQDSVFIDSVAKQAVIRQSPEADAVVKTGRTIYLTINRAIPPLVEMPNLAGFSLRSAELYLQSMGLKLGYVTYRPDFARNAVLEQRYNEVPIAPGTKIPLGSVISFVLGSGIGEGDMDVPDLVGLSLEEAKKYLVSLGISMGAVVATEPVKDSAKAFVIKQSPLLFSDQLGPNGEKVPNKIKSGQIIDVFISETPPIKDTTSAITQQQ
ncbi:MAG: PASTA domain-containing protein [Sphingobacteriia bacterium]|nr:MAG: PASTA domain-containing protein [Sphingobacteriia bacterium]